MKRVDIKHLLTAQGESLEEIPWNVYPRPDLKRSSFFCLNGKWSLSVPDHGIEACEITVPFAPESLLSGVNKTFGVKTHLFYQKQFSLPENFKKDRVIINFGAVDQKAIVSLNGYYIGEHNGGYTPFSFDITDRLAEENVLSVEVIDDLSDRSQLYGKQRYKRGGMWYTPVSGIWQSVWLESVPEQYIKALRFEVNGNTVEVHAEGVSSGTVTVKAPQGEIKSELTEGSTEITLTDPRKWSPTDPYLYEVEIEAEGDFVVSYFAVRDLAIKNIDGKPRLCLNGEPIFLHALLDQGYFSDGIYTPASPELYEQDILTAKKLGFNTLRKHIKIEPKLFYYYCDKYGMLVMQDMVNNGSYSFIRDTALPTAFMKIFPDRILNLSKKTRRTFIENAKRTVELLYNHPSVIYYTVFNEGWGQFCASKVYAELKKLDPSRFFDAASGWYKTLKSDVVSDHVYFKKVRLRGNSKKPTVVSEFGGYSYKCIENSANAVYTYGYRKFDLRSDFENAVVKLYTDEIVPLVDKGLCGAVYTQLSDVEDETNGLLTYDRRVLKVDPEKMLKVSEMLKIKF